MLNLPKGPAPPTANATAASNLAPQVLAGRLPPLLSVIAGMVDLTGFLTLGNVFTAHITGNLVVIAALVVRGGRINVTQILAIPVFVLAVTATWMLARTSAMRGLVLLRLLLSVQ